jgi:hypothetical protein
VSQSVYEAAAGGTAEANTGSTATTITANSTTSSLAAVTATVTVLTSYTASVAASIGSCTLPPSRESGAVGYLGQGHVAAPAVVLQASQQPRSFDGHVRSACVASMPS